MTDRTDDGSGTLPGRNYTYEHQQEGLDIIHWHAGPSYGEWETRCFVYEIWDVNRRLVYVGIADNFEHRWGQHVQKSWWMGEVVIDYIVVRGYPSRTDARMWEALAINEQAPIYNTAREAPTYARALVGEPIPSTETTTYIYLPAGELTNA